MEGWHTEPREPEPSRAMRMGIVALTLTVLVALAGVAHTVATRAGAEAVPSSPQNDETVPPVAASTWGVGSQAPLPGAGDWTLPELAWAPLPAADPASPLFEAQETDLDPLSPVTLRGCPSPGLVTSAEVWRTAVAEQWDCVHRAWVPVLQGLGWPTAQPTIEFYTGEGSASQCGYLEAPAFYCSAGDGVVHFGEGHLRMAQSWDLAVSEMVNHEYGHHLQHLAGITDVKLTLNPDAELERRAELQATCWSAMMTRHNQAVAFNDEALASWRARLDTMLVDGLHGSRESIRYWGVKGLYAAAVGDCNTWVAPSELVA